jgi:N-acyl-L-homoserine lactone synthetase
MNSLPSLIELFLFRPFRALLQLYIHSSPTRFERIRQGSELSESVREEISRFRESQYAGRQDYLIPITQDARIEEDALDLRSYHAIARDRSGRILAVARFTPYPFETTRLLGEAITRSFSDHLEISRVVCAKRRSGIGRRLLIQGGCFAIASQKYRGFIAVCKSGNLGIFEKFGLEAHGIHLIPGRPATPYHFISAGFHRITTTTFSYTRRKLAHAVSVFLSPLL